MQRTSTLEGEVAIVTGAGSKDNGLGTGKATAILLARAGADLVLVDRHDDRVLDTQRLVEAEGSKAITIVLDLATAADCERVVESAEAAFGGVDILVNNAAAFHGVGILDTTAEILDEALGVNLIVPFMLSKAALPSMVQRGGGSIVFISSVVALRGPGPHAYATAKAGLMGLTVSLATTFGTQGVRANTVTPGMVATPMRAASVAGAGLDEETMTVGKSTATGNAGDAWDIAEAVVFLCTPAARHITGVDLPVDGGATVRLP
jgi:NAD(P)-dependent dehydrogenase (short-subunit alcohol dehydrogenase family)